MSGKNSDPDPDARANTAHLREHTKIANAKGMKGGSGRERHDESTYRATSRSC